MAGAEQRGRGLEVVRRQRERVSDGSHGVAELQTGVPDRVPELLGDADGVDRRADQEQQVEVGLRAELTSALATESDEGDVLVGDRLVEQLDQPALDQVAVGADRSRGR